MKAKKKKSRYSLIILNLILWVVLKVNELQHFKILSFPGGSDGKKKKSTCNAGDPGSIPGSGRYPGEGNGCLLQYFCLKNPTARGARLAIVYRVTKSGHN